MRPEKLFLRRESWGSDKDKEWQREVRGVMKSDKNGRCLKCEQTKQNQGEL